MTSQIRRGYVRDEKGCYFISGEWMETIPNVPEAGMGYTVVTITLNDGRKFKQVAIDSGWLSRVRDHADIPLREVDIAAINATHAKWDWGEKP